GSHVLPFRAWRTARDAGGARTRSTSITPPSAAILSITGAAWGGGGAPSPFDSGPMGSGSAARSVAGPQTEVKDKLQLMHDELREGTRSAPRYTLQDHVDDFLTHGLEGRSAKTVSTNREVLAPLTALIGGAKLKELTAADVRSALGQLATSRSTRAVQ